MLTFSSGSIVLGSQRHEHQLALMVVNQARSESLGIISNLIKPPHDEVELLHGQSEGEYVGQGGGIHRHPRWRQLLRVDERILLCRVDEPIKVFGDLQSHPLIVWSFSLATNRDDNRDRLGVNLGHLVQHALPQLEGHLKVLGVGSGGGAQSSENDGVGHGGGSEGTFGGHGIERFEEEGNVVRVAEEGEVVIGG